MAGGGGLEMYALGGGGGRSSSLFGDPKQDNKVNNNKYKQDTFRAGTNINILIVHR